MAARCSALILSSSIAGIILISGCIRAASVPSPIQAMGAKPALIDVAVQPGAADLKSQRLKCEYFEEPCGIQTSSPRLSWELVSNRRGDGQTAYRILVSDIPNKLASGSPDMWDSGKTKSSQSIGISYQGNPLVPGRLYYWKVMVWGKDGTAAPYSSPSFWQMGLLQQSDWKAEWISAQWPNDTVVDGEVLAPVPYFRKTFRLAKPIKQATVFATARGVYELHLNGSKVSGGLDGWAMHRFSRGRPRTIFGCGNLRQHPRTDF